jgi:AraC family transcriptional regulator of adaptative response/methylated-DNA-[protein]-cysteine methyltransferase
MIIGYMILDCPLGRLLVAATGKGVCRVSLGDADDDLIRSLFREYPAAAIRRADTGLEGYATSLLAYLSGRQPHLNLPLDIRATAFQRRVYAALLSIPYGSTRSYEEIATAIGNPRAGRPVAGACASNPVALVIPCHRVIRKDGSLGGYGGGLWRKKCLLELEKTGCSR